MTMTRELTVYGGLLILLTVWVSLPLLPAVLIYRLFPDTAVAVSGPLARLTFKATGAFGAYLIVFFALYHFITTQVYNVVGGFFHPSWTITGKLNLIDKNGKPVHAQRYFQNLTIRTQPELHSFGDPTFRITIPEGENGLRVVILDIPAFGQYYWEPKNVKPGEEEIDWFNKTIELKTPIEIRQTTTTPSDDNAPLTVPAQ